MEELQPLSGGRNDITRLLDSVSGTPNTRIDSQIDLTEFSNSQGTIGYQDEEMTLDNLYKGRSNAQSNFQKFKLGAAKTTFKSLTAAAGGLYSIPMLAQEMIQGGANLMGIDALGTGRMSDLWDNTVHNWLANADKAIDEKYQIYSEKAYHDNNLGQQAFGKDWAKFWFDDVGQGMSFVIGAAIAESVAAAGTAATFGAASPALVATTASIMTKIPSIFSKMGNVNRLGAGLKYGRQLATGAFYEAGVEARHFREEAITSITNKKQQELGRKLTEEEALNVKNYATKVSNPVFAMNASLVHFSNIHTMGRTFGAKLTDAVGFPKMGLNNFVSSVTPKIYRTAKNATEKFALKHLNNSAFKGVASIAKPVITEGFIEEAGQSAISSGALKYAVNSYDKDSQIELSDIMLSSVEQYMENFGSKQFYKEVALGGIIGLAGSPTFVKKGKDNKLGFGIGWQTGAQSNWESLTNYFDGLQKRQAAIENTSQALKQHFKSATGINSAYKDLEKAVAAKDMFAAKSAENELLFRSIYAAHENGTVGHLLDQVDSLDKQVDPEDMKNALEYKDSNQEEFNTRKRAIAKKYKEKIKEVLESISTVENRTDNTLSSDVKEALAYSLVAAKDSDVRKEKLAEEIRKVIPEFESSSDVDLSSYLFNALPRPVQRQIKREFNNADKDLDNADKYLAVGMRLFYEGLPDNPNKLSIDKNLTKTVDVLNGLKKHIKNLSLLEKSKSVNPEAYDDLLEKINDFHKLTANKRRLIDDYNRIVAKDKYYSLEQLRDEVLINEYYKQDEGSTNKDETSEFEEGSGNKSVGEAASKAVLKRKLITPLLRSAILHFALYSTLRWGHIQDSYRPVTPIIILDNKEAQKSIEENQDIVEDAVENIENKKLPEEKEIENIENKVENLEEAIKNLEESTGENIDDEQVQIEKLNEQVNNNVVKIEEARQELAALKQTLQETKQLAAERNKSMSAEKPSAKKELEDLKDTKNIVQSTANSTASIVINDEGKISKPDTESKNFIGNEITKNYYLLKALHKEILNLNNKLSKDYVNKVSEALRYSSYITDNAPKLGLTRKDPLVSSVIKMTSEILRDKNKKPVVNEEIETIENTEEQNVDDKFIEEQILEKLNKNLEEFAAIFKNPIVINEATEVKKIVEKQLEPVEEINNQIEKIESEVKLQEKIEQEDLENVVHHEDNVFDLNVNTRRGLESLNISNAIASGLDAELLELELVEYEWGSKEFKFNYGTNKEVSVYNGFKTLNNSEGNVSIAVKHKPSGHIIGYLPDPFRFTVNIEGNTVPLDFRNSENEIYVGYLNKEFSDEGGLTDKGKAFLENIKLMQNLLFDLKSQDIKIGGTIPFTSKFSNVESNLKFKDIKSTHKLSLRPNISFLTANDAVEMNGVKGHIILFMENLDGVMIPSYNYSLFRPLNENIFRNLNEEEENDFLSLTSKVPEGLNRHQYFSLVQTPNSTLYLPMKVEINSEKYFQYGIQAATEVFKSKFYNQDLFSPENLTINGFLKTLEFGIDTPANLWLSTKPLGESNNVIKSSIYLAARYDNVPSSVGYPNLSNYKESYNIIPQLIIKFRYTTNKTTVSTKVFNLSNAEGSNIIWDADNTKFISKETLKSITSEDVKKAAIFISQNIKQENFPSFEVTNAHTEKMVDIQESDIANYKLNAVPVRYYKVIPNSSQPKKKENKLKEKKEITVAKPEKPDLSDDLTEKDRVLIKSLNNRIKTRNGEISSFINLINKIPEKSLPALIDKFRKKVLADIEFYSNYKNSSVESTANVGLKEAKNLLVALDNIKLDSNVDTSKVQSENVLEDQTSMRVIPKEEVKKVITSQIKKGLITRYINQYNKKGASDAYKEKATDKLKTIYKNLLELKVTYANTNLSKTIQEQLDKIEEVIGDSFIDEALIDYDIEMVDNEGNETIQKEYLPQFISNILVKQIANKILVREEGYDYDILEEVIEEIRNDYDKLEDDSKINKALLHALIHGYETGNAVFLANKITEALDFNLVDLPNSSLFKEVVNKLKNYGIEMSDVIKLDDNDLIMGELDFENSDFERYDTSIMEISPEKSFSKRLKLFIGSIVKYEDIFNFDINNANELQELGFETYLDEDLFYNKLSNILSDTLEVDFFPKIVALSKSDNDYKLFYEAFTKATANYKKTDVQSVKDILNSGDLQSIETLMDYNLVNLFFTAFNFTKITPINVTYNSETKEVRSYNTSLSGTTSEILFRWQSNFVSEKHTKASAQKTLSLISFLYKQLGNLDSIENSNFVKNATEVLGIELDFTNYDNYVTSLDLLFSKLGFNFDKTYLEYSLAVFYSNRESLWDKLPSDTQQIFNGVLALVSKSNLEPIHGDRETSNKKSALSNNFDVLKFLINRSSLPSNKDSANNSSDFFGFYTEDNDKGIGLLRNYAMSHAYFDKNTSNISVVDASGNRIYDKIKHSFLTRQFLHLRSIAKNKGKFFELIKSIYKGENDVDKLAVILIKSSKINGYTINKQEAKFIVRSVMNNPIITTKDFSELSKFMENLDLQFLTGLIDDTGNNSIVKGKSYTKLQTRSKIINKMSLFNENTANSRVPIELLTFADKNLQFFPTIQLEVFHKYNSDSGDLEINNKGREFLAQILKNELTNISSFVDDIIDIAKGGDTVVISNYHTGDYFNESGEKMSLKDLINLYDKNNPEDSRSNIIKILQESAVRNTHNKQLRGLKTFRFSNLEGIENIIKEAIAGEVIPNLGQFYGTEINNLLMSQFKNFRKLLVNYEITTPEGKNNLLSEFYESTEGNVSENALITYYLNDYLFSTALSNFIYADPRIQHIDEVDVVKRNGNIPSNGDNMGRGTTNYTAIAIPEFELEDYESERTGIEAGAIDSTDAQTYASFSWFKRVYLKATSKLNKSIEHELDLIELGLDFMYKPNYKKLENFNIWGHSKKLVERSLMTLVKTSVSIEQVSKSANLKQDVIDYLNKNYPADAIGAINYVRSLLAQENGFNDVYEAKKGREWGFKLLKKFTDTKNDMLITTSSLKTGKLGIINNIDSITDNSINTLSNINLVEQVNSDGFKEKVTHSTQLMSLIWSEIENNLNLIFNKKETNAKDLSVFYRSMIGKRFELSLQNKIKELFKDKDFNEKDYTHLINKIISGLKDNPSDDVLSVVFGNYKEDNGNKTPLYNYNLSFIQVKLQQYFQSLISEDLFSQKVTGNKFTLQSSYGINVRRLVSKSSKKSRDQYNELSEEMRSVYFLHSDGFFYMQSKTLSSNQAPNTAVISKINSLVKKANDINKKSFEANSDSEILNNFSDFLEVVVELKDLVGINMETIESFIDEDGYISEDGISNLIHNRERVDSEDLFEIVSRLRHKVWDSNEKIWYSEAIASSKAASIGHTLFGVRIPTQANSFMANLRIVDTFPYFQGNNLSVPHEIVKISGADFDFDAMYAHSKNGNHGNYLKAKNIKAAINAAKREITSFIHKKSSTYVNSNERYIDAKNNFKENFKKYVKNSSSLNLSIGSYDIPDVLSEAKEVLAGNTSTIFTNKSAAKVFVDYYESNKEELNKIRNEIINDYVNSIYGFKTLEKYLKSLESKIKSNYEHYNNGDFNNYEPLNKPEADNVLLDLQISLLHNNKEAAAETASLQILKDLKLKEIYDENSENKKTIDVKSTENKSNIEGVLTYNKNINRILSDKLDAKRRKSGDSDRISLNKEETLELFKDSEYIHVIQTLLGYESSHYPDFKMTYIDATNYKTKKLATHNAATGNVSLTSNMKNSSYLSADLLLIHELYHRATRASVGRHPITGEILNKDVHSQFTKVITPVLENLTQDDLIEGGFIKAKGKRISLLAYALTGQQVSHVSEIDMSNVSFNEITPNFFTLKKLQDWAKSKPSVIKTDKNFFETILNFFKKLFGTETDTLFHDIVAISTYSLDKNLFDNVIRDDANPFIDFNNEIEKDYEIEEDINLNQASEIYSKLGNKTVSEGIDIVKVYQKEGAKLAQETGRVFSMIVTGSKTHFGNQFSSRKDVADKFNLELTNSTKESVEKYIDWVISSSDKRAEWIRSVLDSGKLKGRNVIYYKELGEPSHATALKYLIENWNNIKHSKKSLLAHPIQKDDLRREEKIQGINIKTDKNNPNSLGNRLTNPNWYAKDLFDVESHYKRNASKKKAPHLNAEEALRFDMNLMYKLQVKKFQQNPELIDEINEAGGLEFIHSSSHEVGVKNSRWEGKGLESNFIKVLSKSYTKVAKDLSKFKVSTSNKLSPFTNHSGGAVGADSQWDKIGKEFGMVNNNHYYFKGFKTPIGNTPISLSLKNEADEKLKAANKFLKRTFPTSKEYVNNLLRRNWWQVKNSDAIFAVSTIKWDKRKEKGLVQGGTAWAVYMAIAEKKPVYVFDQDYEGWFEWQYDEGEDTGWIETSTPVLTKNFAGIGTREINESGKQAIRDVYTKSLKDQSDLQENELERVPVKQTIKDENLKSIENEIKTGNTATTTDVTSDNLGMQLNTLGQSINDFTGKTLSRSVIDMGKKNISISAKYSVMHQLLAETEIELPQVKKEGEYQRVKIFGKYSKFVYKTDHPYYSRVNTILSTVLSAMTDDTKERLADPLQMRTEALGAILTMLGLGVPINQVTFLMLQPSVREFVDKLVKSKAAIKLKDENKLSSFNINTIISSVTGDKYSSSMQLFKEALDYHDLSLETLKSAIVQNDLSLNQKYNLKFNNNKLREISDAALATFVYTYSLSEQMRNFNSTTSLMKSLKPNLESYYTIESDLDNLNLKLVKNDKTGNYRLEAKNSLRSNNYLLTPYDFLNIVENVPYLGEFLNGIAKIKDKVVPEFFITQSESSKEIIDFVENGINEFKIKNVKFRQSIKQEYLNSLLSRALFKSFYPNSSNEELHEKMLEVLFGNRMQELYYKIRESNVNIDEEYKESLKRNIFLKYITHTGVKVSENNYNKKEMNLLRNNVWTNKSPTVLNNIISGWKELMVLSKQSEEVKEFTELVVQYISLKDSTFMRNNSLIKYMSSEVVQLYSDVTDNIELALKNKDDELLRNLTGYNFQEFKFNFYKNFVFHSNNDKFAHNINLEVADSVNTELSAISFVLTEDGKSELLKLSTIEPIESKLDSTFDPTKFYTGNRHLFIDFVGTVLRIDADVTLNNFKPLVRTVELNKQNKKINKDFRLKRLEYLDITNKEFYRYDLDSGILSVIDEDGNFVSAPNDSRSGVIISRMKNYKASSAYYEEVKSHSIGNRMFFNYAFDYDKLKEFQDNKKVTRLKSGINEKIFSREASLTDYDKAIEEGAMRLFGLSEEFSGENLTDLSDVTDNSTKIFENLISETINGHNFFNEGNEASYTTPFKIDLEGTNQYVSGDVKITVLNASEGSKYSLELKLDPQLTSANKFMHRIVNNLDQSQTDFIENYLFGSKNNLNKIFENMMPPSVTKGVKNTKIYLGSNSIAGKSIETIKKENNC